ncbi:hypothetical protein COLO4_08245 [Corchorus olitorius]|uniref:Uncharacterized protein n=1 Tax=Corchorus olitorius TaxID=93759 RepID=A0A1R3KGP3_9ROSI|nr:hypothetical protein COLO4_08245 [Corchorus olitorius]
MTWIATWQKTPKHFGWRMERVDQAARRRVWACGCSVPVEILAAASPRRAEAGSGVSC